MYKNFVKRTLDFSIAFIALLVLFVPFAVIALWLHFANKGAGAFFTQERPGLHGKTFRVIKFKSMTDEKGLDGKPLPDAQRLTKAGKFVRGTSLDELPQLINVLKGDMSFVGPRPLLIQYMPLYSDYHLRRYEVRPGITGWAQVNGRNMAKFSQKFDNDVWYVEHCSFLTDVRILWMTVLKVLKRADVGEGEGEMGVVDDLKFSSRLVKFGSDYPALTDFKKGISLPQIHPEANYYASGRQAIEDVVKKNGWNRLWVPSYFCYESLEGLKRSDIELTFYTDYPGNDDEASIKAIDFREGDALLRMNYFGLRRFRDNGWIKQPVIEDHSHDLVGDWATKSNADYCIASIRKSLPISEGGILWSPKKLFLPNPPIVSSQNSVLSAMRWDAMKLKAEYLEGKNHDRMTWRNEFIKSEEMFDTLPISKISVDAWNILDEIDVQDWYDRKKHNWGKMQELATTDVRILQPEHENANPFSLVLVFATEEMREKVRSVLIKRQTVYPAVLWTLPMTADAKSKSISTCMLSIHCDGRYDNDLDEMIERIREGIKIAKSL